MDYQRIYREFIADRKAKPKPEGYSERHHIQPRSLGGGDDPQNLISLSAEDHFFAHLLLAKIYGRGMWAAVRRMRWGRTDGERPWVRGRYMYGVARRELAAFLSAEFSGQDGRKGPDNPRYDNNLLEWVNLDSGERLTATKWEMWDRFGGSRAHWTSAASGARRSMLGWTAKPESVRIRGHRGKAFSFVNRDGRAFHGTQTEFAKRNGLSAASASRVVRHADVTLCGWRLAGNDDRRGYEPRSGGYAWQYRTAERGKRQLSA